MVNLLGKSRKEVAALIGMTEPGDWWHPVYWVPANKVTAAGFTAHVVGFDRPGPAARCVTYRRATC